MNAVRFATSLMLSTLMLPVASAGETAAVGTKAPGFTLKDQTGREVSLADFEGRVVVLEWVNPDCPFVQRHHQAGTMGKLAESYAGKGVVWLAVNSTHYMGASASAAFHDAHELPYPILVDSDGRVGHLYGARTTPHMFVIAADGTLAYSGAIDDDPRGSSGADVHNYVAKALDELLAGKTVSVTGTKPYGCSVKYQK